MIHDRYYVPFKKQNRLNKRLGNVSRNNYYVNGFGVRRPMRTLRFKAYNAVSKAWCIHNSKYGITLHFGGEV